MLKSLQPPCNYNDQVQIGALLGDVQNVVSQAANSISFSTYASRAKSNDCRLEELWNVAAQIRQALGVLRGRGVAEGAG